MRPKLRIGLILPGSNFIGKLASEVRHSLVAGLTSGGFSGFELFIETTPYNADKKQLREKLQDLLIKHEVDVIIAPLNVGLIHDVEDLMRGQNVPFVALSLGEDVCVADHAPPWVFVNSFNLWQSCWLAGHRAVTEFGQKVCCLNAAHEGGYGLGFAFALGVEAAGGHNIGTFVTPVEPSEAEALERWQWCQQLEPDVVMVFGSDEAGEAIWQAYSQLNEKPTAIGLGPVLFQPDLKLPASRAALYSCFACLDPKSDAAQQFLASSTERSGLPTSAYGILAFETGLLLAHALEGGDGGNSGKALHAALLQSTCDGPRGPIAFDAEVQETVAPQYRLDIGNDAEGNRLVASVKPVTPPALMQEQIGLARKKIAKQGWLNPYMVA